MCNVRHVLSYGPGLVGHFKFPRFVIMCAEICVNFDPIGQPTVKAAHVVRPYSSSQFSNLAKQNKENNVGLAEWIIDDTSCCTLILRFCHIISASNTR